MEIYSRNLILWAFLAFFFRGAARAEIIQMPRFVGPVANVTVPLGREAVITCSVESLNSYKVAFVRVDTQTILTIHTHVITRSHRIGLSHADPLTWNLHIKNVKENDRGFYMCQINTDPMMSQTGFLQVVVPPDILDYPTSTDMVVRENTNVTLQCAATGFPKPSIVWRREDKQKIAHGEQSVDTVEGAVFSISKVNRLHMGAYFCIASNSVPPTVSRRITLIVHFPPMISITHQLVGALEGQDVVLECNSEAYPKSINYWSRDTGEIIVSGEKFEAILVDNTYRVTMRLTIREVAAADFGTYICLSKNSLGETDGQIKLYPLVRSTLAAKTTTLPSSSGASASSDKVGVGGKKRGGKLNDTKGKTNFTKVRNEFSDNIRSRSSSNEMVASEPKDSTSGSGSISWTRTTGKFVPILTIAPMTTTTTLLLLILLQDFCCSFMI